MELTVRTKQRTYSVFIGRGYISRIAELAGILNNAFIVTDSGVPACWIEKVTLQYPKAPVFMMQQGESNKNLDTYTDLLRSMISSGLNRNDTVIAVGGGVVGDLAGFAAATYMRGIRFVNIPTTMLAQIDSSIGGKTAVDMDNYKNIVGAFWQPHCVIIDPDTLTTLPSRHISNGLAEAVKMGMIRDEALFELFEDDMYTDRFEQIITRSVELKKEIVEEDEYEGGLRKILNFGHTIGHGYESYFGFDRYLHGECVAMGMLRILENEEIKCRLKTVLQRIGLPTHCNADADKLIDIIRKDKKAESSETISVIQVRKIGEAEIESLSLNEIKRRLSK